MASFYYHYAQASSIQRTRRKARKESLERRINKLAVQLAQERQMREVKGWSAKLARIESDLAELTKGRIS